jgi:hypothetical protein
MNRVIVELALFAGALICMAAPMQGDFERSAGKMQPHCSLARAAERRDRVEPLPISGTAEVAESLCAASTRVAEHG